MQKTPLIWLALLLGIAGAAWANAADPSIDVEVTARQWREPLQSVPGSVSVLTPATLQSAGITTEREAATLVPNLIQPDFSARWLNFPYIRGIGAGQNNPAVTTLIDGVPQLSYATSNLELLDVARIEFLRGPQGSLYGRNALGGVINIVPALPSDTLESMATLTPGTHGLLSVRARISGPLPFGPLGSLSGGYSARDGYTKNDTTGNYLDNREAFFARGQLLQTAHTPWTFRLSGTWERDRDGDYALTDLVAARNYPFHVNHDFEGFTNRDVAQPVLTATRAGDTCDMTSITALQWWKVDGATDGDFSPVDYIRSGSTVQQQGWTEDIRFTNPAATPLTISPRLTARWLLGAFAFTAKENKDSFSEYRPKFATDFGLPFAYTSRSTATLRAAGVSPYGQVAVTLDGRTDLTVGLRHDYERKTGDLTGFDPTNPAKSASLKRDFNQTSPQLSLGYHLTPDALCYASWSKGYKTGGFNGYAPAGQETYNDETSQMVEAGVKATAFSRRLTANLALFSTAWNDIQLDVPTFPAGTAYIANAGKAYNKGGEVELTVRPRPWVDLFGGVGLLDAHFRAGSMANGQDMTGNTLPFAPNCTWHAGAQVQGTVWQQWAGTARLDVQTTSKFFYDAVNGAAQPRYTVANLHLGAAKGRVRVEAWVNNLFDARYVPVALPVPLPTVGSGYVGETAAPRTAGASVGIAL
jgi:iron complex outermembrane receptor protein